MLGSALRASKPQRLALRGIDVGVYFKFLFKMVDIDDIFL